MFCKILLFFYVEKMSSRAGFAHGLEIPALDDR